MPTTWRASCASSSWRSWGLQVTCTQKPRKGLESALKFKETSSLQAEAFSGAEIKHGPMALVQLDSHGDVWVVNGGNNRLEHFAAEGERRSVVDFAMHCRLRPDAKLIEQIPQSIAYGVTSIKMFQAYKKRGMLFADDQLLRGMELTGAHGGIALVHAENGHVIDYLEDKLTREGKTAPEFYLSSRPHVAEAEAVSRAIDIASLAGCPLYVVHLSTADGLEHIGRARARGQTVFAETCPQYLFLSLDDMKEQMVLGFQRYYVRGVVMSGIKG